MSKYRYQIIGVLLVLFIVALSIMVVGYFNKRSQVNEIDKIINEIDKPNSEELDFGEFEVKDLGYEEDEKFVEDSIIELDSLIKDLNIDNDFETFSDISY